MSPSTSSMSSATWTRFSLRPVAKLSSTRTSWPSARHRSTTCDPTKPPPPVIRTRISASLEDVVRRLRVPVPFQETEVRLVAGSPVGSVGGFVAQADPPERVYPAPSVRDAEGRREPLRLHFSRHPEVEAVVGGICRQRELREVELDRASPGSPKATVDPASQLV